MAAQLNLGKQFGIIDRREAFERYVTPILQRPASVKTSAIDDALAMLLSGKA